MDNIEKSLNILQSLINASEKASNIARICRSNTKLLSLLVQEKTGNEANKRFQHDFKTLADVLIQETIKNDIGKLFPAMRNTIKGEESPSFTNGDGVNVSIEISQSKDETAECLIGVMQDEEAANALALEVHRNVEYNGEELGEIPILTDLDYANLGIWIDPIDATAEYISAEEKLTNYPNIAASGLECVTVLIGVYERDTGIPVIGVISQPFLHRNAEKNDYVSHIYWGVSLPKFKAHNCAEIAIRSRGNSLAICSSSEQIKILNALKEAGFDAVPSAGAGYKALKVITDDADIYLLSKGSTFKWDTCAPQAILRALNGDILDFSETVKQRIPTSVKYLEQQRHDEMTTSEDLKCNSGGIVAIRDLNLLNKLFSKIFI